MELWELTAGDLARAIAGGEVSARDVVDAHIARIERCNPAINAIVLPRFDEARSEAAEADRKRAAGEPLGPLGGVPITVKECLDVAGMAATFGLPSRVHDVATADDAYVARLRAAGAIVVGKTNLSQLMIYIESDNPLYGRSNNPWNLDRTPGGSSGGEGAAIAAGFAPVGFGTDIGGSIRVPAAFNGIFGLKATTGRMPDPSRVPVFRGQKTITSECGPFARTTADLALAFEIANGGRAPAVLPPRPLFDYPSVDVRSLRIGYYERLGSFAPAPAVARAAREAAAAFEAMGATVVPFDPPHPDQARDLFFGILSADGGKDAIAATASDPKDPRVAELLQIVSRPRSQLALLERVLPLVGEKSIAELVRNYGHTDAHHYWKLVEAVDAYRTLFSVAMDRADGGPLDLIVCPPCGLPALRHGRSREVLTAGTYAPLYNLLGYPAGVVPFTRVRADEELGRKPSRGDRVERGAFETEVGSAGLPIGVQIAGRPWREHEILAAMAALERVARERGDFPTTPVTPHGS